MARVWLDVPFAQKDEAKAHGARWDPEARRWYAPRPHMPGLDRWAALPDVPDLLPGEDRSFGAGLFVDLVPQSCWFTNVPSCVSPQDWERLRRMINDRAGQRCEACGQAEDREARRWLEAHERWDYDTAAAVQRLRRLVCLCTDCHTATHFGLAEVKGKRDAALSHLRVVTGMSPDQAEDHVRAAVAVWRERSARTWTLDLSVLTDAGVSVVRPQAAEERKITAQRTTARERGPAPAPGAALSPSPASPSRTSAPDPPRETVSGTRLDEALRKVFSRPAAGGGVQWIAAPHWTWFCRMCDSDVRPPDIAVASVRETPGENWEIVCRPCEWAHIVDEVGLSDAEHRSVMAAAAKALAVPGTAVSWDIHEGRFRVISGRLVDKQPERRRPLW
ncbi:DUF5710 domain-containing protein [Streptomyces sp. NPDC018833]|uniref:DUF5710 domain-containing protein n=1 Tax=Streptomyces sp. NPDC018833 TaxID=3365053 RepID=UPI0037954B97